MSKFLVIRFSSIGDIVLTTPVIRCMRKQMPDAEIHFLVKNAFKAIVENNPYIDRIHVLAGDLQQTLRELEKEKFDYIIDLHHNLRTFKIKRFLMGVKSFSFNKLNIEKFIYTAFKINTLPDKHIVDRNIETVVSFGIVNDGLGLDYFVPDKDRVKEEDIPAAHREGYVALVVGASLATKKLPLHKLKELCTAIRYPIILLGAKEESDEGEEIAALDTVRIFNACGKFNINKSSDFTHRAKLVISPDTGLMHIAAAFKRPVITVWGNTVPAFGMYPYYGEKSDQQYYNSEVNHLWCRPCSKIGYKKCPLGHFKCMEKNDINEIARLANDIMQK
ncbi:MAG: glycosyltransferase family 9 protein [Ferruginibacter sp.]